MGVNGSMKIAIIGAGAIGKYIREGVEPLGDVIVGSRSSEQYPIDIGDKESIEQFFKQVGECDHIINTAGKTDLVLFKEATDEQFENSIRGKLMGQVNCIRVGSKYLKKGGSITLITGYLSHVPTPTVVIPAMVNAALERLVFNVNIEMKDQIRINALSPAMLKESMEKYGVGIFKDYPVVPGADVGEACRKILESTESGKVYRIGWNIEEGWE